MRANPSRKRSRPARLIPLCLALASFGAIAADAQPAIRGVWVDAFHSGFKSTSQVNTLVSRAASGNYNAIFAEVLAYHDDNGGGHGAYWNSSIVPKADDVSASFDPLAYLVTQAHTAGIEVHAWIVPYRVSTVWPPAGNTLLASHPEWLMVSLADMGGGPAKIDGKYVLDPGSPDAQAYLISIVQELVTDYAIDGINFDYIRYTQVDAGYPADENYAYSSLARFQYLTWYVGVPAPHGVTSWNDFRRRTIDEFVRRSRVEIATLPNPRQPLRFTADLITFGNAPANFIYGEPYALHQNWKYWLEQGYLDAGIPMNYKREHISSEALWYRNWINAALNWRGSRHIVGGQGNYLNTKANSVTQLQYCLNAGAHGTCNYSYIGTADEDLDGDWESDWTWYPYVAAQLFTTPVATPDMPWRNPATAVEGTLWGQITNPTTGEPIDGARVQVDGFDPVYADGNGYYVMTMIPATSGGTVYDISAMMWGCPEVVVENVVILPGDAVRLDLELCSSWVPGDVDEDGDIDATDAAYVLFCLAGPDDVFASGHFCLNGDADNDLDLDLSDVARFQQVYEGP